MASSSPEVVPDNVLVVGNDKHAFMQHVYKGKTARSWQQLPGEIVRHVSMSLAGPRHRPA